MAGAVLTERRDQVLVITLNRPDARNAVNAALAQGVATALDELDGDARAVSVGVLTGAGKGFCAGMDLKAFVQRREPARGRAAASRASRSGPPDKPLIAAVEGHAVAGGFELALARGSDCRRARRKVRLAGSEARVGRGGWRAACFVCRGVSRITSQWRRGIALTGEPVPAERLHALGLVNRVVSPGTALDAAVELAPGASHENKPASAPKATKQMPGRGARMDRRGGHGPSNVVMPTPRCPGSEARRRVRERVRREARPGVEGRKVRMTDSLRGQLLIAAPQLSDYFRRTVVLVVEHTEEGAMGVVLNRPTETVVAEAVPELADLADPEDVIHAGGPVAPDAVIALGDFEEPDEAGTPVAGSLGLVDPERPDPRAAAPARVRRLCRTGRPASWIEELEAGGVDRRAGGRRRPLRPRATCGPPPSSARAAPTPCWQRMPADPTLN